MKSISLFTKDILPIVLAVTTVFSILSKTNIAQSGIEFQRKLELKRNCANFHLSEGERRQTILDPQKEIVLVRWFEANRENHLELPYDTGTNFSDCSSDAKHTLSHIKEVYQEQVAETCFDFGAIIRGERPMMPMNGEMPNIQGAINYVNKYCK